MIGVHLDMRMTFRTSKTVPGNKSSLSSPGKHIYSWKSAALPALMEKNQKRVLCTTTRMHESAA
jgi:hypothetical protein